MASNNSNEIYETAVNDPTNIKKIAQLVEEILKESLKSGWGFVFRIQNQ